MRAYGLAMVSALMWSAGCTENELHKNLLTGDVDADIEVNPSTLNFGTLSSEDEAAVQSFTVTNVGTTDLILESLNLEGGAFTLLTDLEDQVLPAGELVTVDVAFEPQGGDEHLGEAWVLSNDPDEGSVPVDLVGYGAAPDLEITPAVYDFGVKFIDCPDTQEFTLTNVGQEDLVIDSIDYVANGALSLDSQLTLPLVLAPGDESQVVVEFLPSAEGDFEGEIQVVSNDPDGETVAVQTAEGRYVDEVEDVFEVPVNPPVDLIFAVDQSCSMDDDAVSLGNNFATFISAINAYTTDWRIGVATLDTGCFNSGVLKYTTVNYASKFQAAVALGDDAQLNTEKLFTLTNTALSKTGNNGCNAGFLREEALLHIVFVSDEAEQSSSTVSYWVSQLQSYKSDPALVKLSAVTLLGPPYPDQSPYRYWDAVEATGGSLLSLVDDWSDSAEELATASLEGLYDFPLSETPDPASIEVRVDGTQWLTGWHYDAGTNEIQFDLELSGSSVVVNYGVVVPCD